MLTVKKIRSLAVTALFVTGAVAQDPLPPAFPGGSKINYVRTWDAFAPLTNKDTLAAGQGRQVKQVTQYFDGLGRPIEIVSKRTGPFQTDIVSANTYDEFGRESNKYLPYSMHWGLTSDGSFKYDPFADIRSHYNSYFSDSFPYTKTIYERSPLSRPVAVYAPGKSWAGQLRGVTMQYLFNTVSDSVRKWVISSNQPSTSVRYGAGQLEKTITTDEHGKQVVEYKDAQGRIILKKVQIDNSPAGAHIGWLCTYYVYNDLDELVFVLQPKAVQQLIGNSWSFGSYTLDELCFQYSYDERHRMISKKVPGAGVVYMVYDARDRLVMTQDSLMRAAHKWMYTLYDAQDRPTTTGLITDNTYYNNVAYHRGQAQTSISYPNTGSYTNEQLTKTFYDDYSWRSGESNPLSATRSTTYDGYLLSNSNTTWPYPQDATSQSNRLRGMVTGTKTKILGSSNYLYTVIFYDDNGRVIQTQNTNISGGTDITVSQYSWTGQPLVSIIKSEKAVTSSQTAIVLTKLSYDTAWRLLKTEKKISHTKVNSGNMPGNWTTVNTNEYDVLGQALKMKKLGIAPLDSLKYEYNIRGWMLGMNRSYVKDTTSNINWFGFDLGYDKTSFTVNGTSLSYAAAQYNGNISGMLWRSTGDDMLRKYDFTYDAANRLTGADFNQLNANSFNKAAGINFSVSGLTYDVNGNILTMNQKGWKLGGSVTIDSLIYTYNTNSNKLLKVTDNITADNKLGDFNDFGNLGDDYQYDANGNMIMDKNKGLTDVSGIWAVPGITYNHLNLPDSIIVNTKGSIKYVYDAAGNKLKKVVHETGNPDKTTFYLTGMVYQDSVLQFIGHEEGRARINKDSSAIVYDYMIKDHLGNVRMLLTEEKDTTFYPAATMETANAANEEALYSYVAATRWDVSTVSGYPANTPSGNAYVAKVNISETNPFGPAMVLKVMAGDKFNVMVNSWWKSTSTPNTPSNLSNKLIGALENNIGNLQGSKATVAELNSSGVFLPGVTSFFNSQNSGGNSSRPWSFLNWILFDEQFNYVSSSSGFMQVEGSNTYSTLVQSDLPITKSGYLYIYVSNATSNIPVYFDNLQVTHIKGPLLEETHYYPFGLVMAGISSKAAGKLENKRKFNDGTELQSKEFSDGSGLELYATNFRSLDPQLGRWWQIDPKPDYSQSLYSAMNNNPVRFNDPLGDTLVKESDKKAAGNVKTYLNDKKTDIKNNINTKLKKALLSAFGVQKLSKKEMKKLETSVSKLDSRLKEVNTSLGDLEGIISDRNHGYTFRSGSEPDLGDISINDNKNIVIDVGDIDLTVHEIRHANKFNDGRAEIRKDQYGRYGWVYRKGLNAMTWEIDSYRAQFGTNPNSLPDATGYSVDVIDDINPGYIKNILYKGNYLYKDY